MSQIAAAPRPHRLAPPALIALLCAALLALATGCADVPDEPYTDHEEAADFIEEKSAIVGLPGAFEANRIMDDDFFTHAGALTAADVQAFFERTPYGNRSFLASERVGGRSAAEAVVAAAAEYGINPVVLLARMQVEKSLVGKSSRPSRRSVDWAFGCGCADGQACSQAYRGLDRQLACAARTLRTHLDGSRTGSSPWVAGVTRRTLDRVSVRPANHATASLYSYTPWVLRGRGGNWLVWNVTVKFAQALGARLRPPGAAASEPPAPLEPPPPAESAPAPGADDVPAAPESPPTVDEPAPRVLGEWIGEACSDDAACRFADGTSGLCVRLPGVATGMCTVSCEGLCPDLEGHGATFCVAGAHFGGAGGLCTRKAGPDNDNCAAVPGLSPRTASRYVGNSDAAARTAEVCLP